MASIVISDSEDSEGFEPFPVVFKTATTKPYRDEPSSTANGVYTDGTISNGASERHRENHVKQARSRKRKKDPEEEVKLLIIISTNTTLQTIFYVCSWTRLEREKERSNRKQ